MLKRRNFGCKAICLFAVLAVMILSAIPVKGAEEGTVTGTLQQVVKATEIKESPDAEANTLESLEEGTNVIVYGEPQDSWSKIEYKGIEGYIKSEALELYQAESVEALEQEFQEVDEKTMRAIDEYELAQKEKHASGIWIIFIVVLVVLIFGVGIIFARKKNGEEEKE